MSQNEVAWILKVTVILPFPLALFALISCSTSRGRKLFSTVYAILVAGFNLALLHGFLSAGKEVAWGSLRLNHLGFPLFLMINMCSVGAVLYAGFREWEARRPGILIATISLASGLTALAFLVESLMYFALLWEGVTVAAVAGLLAQGGEGMGKRLKSFLPWLISDALFLTGAVLSAVWLKETVVLIEPPLTSGSETQVVIVVLLFLISAIIRLSLFPFHRLARDLFERTDPAWSSYFMGAVNFLLAGFRLLVVAALIGRLVASDWSLAITLIGTASIVVGPLLAVRARNVPGYLAGMYTLQGGFLTLGAGLFSRAAVDGALFCLVVAPLFLTSAIMAAGTVEGLRGSREFNRDRISARVVPAAFVVLLISGMSMVGLPPLDGFVSKTIVLVGSLDKALVNPLYALIAAIALGAVALAAITIARMVGGIFAGGSDVQSRGKAGLIESLVPVTICGVSLLVGIFPGLLLKNFISKGSYLLFPSGASGPGVVFRGTGQAANQAIMYYPVWSETVAAVVLVIMLSAVVLYFAGRTNYPGVTPAARAEPFLGGVSGDFSPSLDLESIFRRHESYLTGWRRR